MTRFGTEEIQRIANEQLRENPTYPVEVVKIANGLGYKIYYLAKDEGPGIAGKVDHENKSIFIRPSDPVQRQRFTIAHEIGHIVLHKNGGQEAHFSSEEINVAIYSDKVEEMEANKFAAMLLMPEMEFRKQWGRHGGLIEGIADYFNVSQLAAAVRANTLGLMPL